MANQAQGASAPAVFQFQESFQACAAVIDDALLFCMLRGGQP